MNTEQDFASQLYRIGILNWQSMQHSGEAFFLRNHLKGKIAPVVVDVGANVGLYSGLALESCPSAQVFAFEPHPETFQKLQRNLPNIQAFNVGMGSAAGSFTMYDYADQASSHASLYAEVFTDIHQRPHRSFDIEIRTLDAVIPELGIEHIDLLKVDVEGHELEVFKGAAQCLQKGMVQAIQFEFNEMNIASRTYFKDFFDYLKGYRFFRLLPNGYYPIEHYSPVQCEIFAFQNIVCFKK